MAESFFRSEYLLVPFEIGVALGLRVQIEATGESWRSLGGRVVVAGRLGEKILVNAGQGGRAVVVGRLGEKVIFDAGHGGRAGGGAGTSGWRRQDNQVAAPGRPGRHGSASGRSGWSRS